MKHNKNLLIFIFKKNNFQFYIILIKLKYLNSYNIIKMFDLTMFHKFVIKNIEFDKLINKKFNNYYILIIKLIKHKLIIFQFDLNEKKQFQFNI